MVKLTNDERCLIHNLHIEVPKNGVPKNYENVFK